VPWKAVLGDIKQYEMELMVAILVWLAHLYQRGRLAGGPFL